MRRSAAEYLSYVACVGNDEQQMEIRFEDENIWLTQKLMAMLYGVEVHTINYHIKKIFSDSELQETAVIRKFLITAPPRWQAIYHKPLFVRDDYCRRFQGKLRESRTIQKMGKWHCERIHHQRLGNGLLKAETRDFPYRQVFR